MRMTISTLLLTLVALPAFAQKASNFKPTVVGAQPQVVNPTPAASPIVQPAATAVPATGMATPKVFMPRPNFNSGQSKSGAAQILQSFMQMFNKGAPPEYLPDGSPNPAYDDYVRNSEDFSGSYDDGFTPGDGDEVKQDYGGLCRQYPINNVNRNFAGTDCSRNSGDRLTCMVCNIFYESGNEPYAGKVAVGQTVMARLFSAQYAGKNDGACDVVYRKSTSKSGRTVAQYSWTIESKNHVLPAGAALQETVNAAKEALCKGPGQFTNYFATAIVNPDWNRVGQCATGPREKIGGHQFCRIGGKPTRTIAQVMAAEGLRPASADAGGATSEQ